MATTSKPKEESTPRPHNAHEAPFNPTRRAREYSVVPTACLAPCTRYPFDCHPHSRKKPGNAKVFAPERLTSENASRTRCMPRHNTRPQGEIAEAKAIS